MYRDIPVGPATSVACGNVKLIIFPLAYPKAKYVVDHISFSFDDLAGEGPDKMRIELIERHAKQE